VYSISIGILINFRRLSGISGILKDRDIFYYADKNGCECDFIIKSQEGMECIQVCWELNTENQDREIKGLLAAMEYFDVKEGKILTFNTEDLILTNGKKIIVKPAWK